MLSFEQTRAMLDEVSDELPRGVFDGLNGGVVLLPDVKRHGDAPGLYILGEYRVEPYGLGRYIVIYHGSLRAVYPGRAGVRRKLREVLFHELTHHIESLAGDRTLEYRDALFLEQNAAAQREEPQ
ncbi:MAG: metallopeptidase family protein [Oscillospiraceae bacterium]|nr:metallopeptidase family protein [Oscillospiraceae bacterium]